MPYFMRTDESAGPYWCPIRIRAMNENIKRNAVNPFLYIELF